MAKEIEFRIKPDGSLSMETFGMTGPEECSKVIEHAMVGLGGTLVEDKKKPEYYDKGHHVYIKH